MRCQSALKKDKHYTNTGRGKSRFIVVSTQNTEFIPVVLFIYYWIIFYTNNCKPVLPHPVCVTFVIIIILNYIKVSLLGMNLVMTFQGRSKVSDWRDRLENTGCF